MNNHFIIKKVPSISVFALVISASLAVSPIRAQDQQNQDNTSIAVIEEIVTIGTRRQGRIASDSNVPVDFFTAEEISKNGSTETARLLEKSIPSLNFPEPALSDAASNIRSATLRGLAPDHTLVLVNGKRRHATSFLTLNGLTTGSAPVDFNLIPSAALRNVQVLRDGAAAQYGSDAIAGVINLALKEDNEGGGITVTYGQYSTKPDGLDTQSQVTDNGDGTVSVGTFGESSFSDGETVTISGYQGFSLGTNGFLTISGEYRDRGLSNRAGLDRRQYYPTVDGNIDQREFTLDRQTFQMGNGDSESISLFANFGSVLSNGAEVYGFASYADVDVESGAFYRRPVDGNNNLIIYPDGFLPRVTSKTKDYSFSTGYKGEFAQNMTYDFNVTYGSNEIDLGVVNSLNASLANDQQAAQGSNFNGTQTEFYNGALEYDQLVLSADFSVPVFSDVSLLSFGAEYRDESYAVSAGEEASFASYPIGSTETSGSPGAQGFGGLTPTNAILGTGGRDNFALYAELDSDITEKFNLSVAARFEDYSDFGSTSDFKLAIRYEVLDWLAFRGAVSTGFRAPSLAQSFFSSSSTTLADDGSLSENVILPVSTSAASSLGALPLDAEESSNFSFGTVITMDSGLSLTLDYYSIDIDDRIILAGSASGDAVTNALIPDLGENNGVTQARWFINGIDTETKGFDIVLDYDFSLFTGNDLGLSLAYNKNETDVIKTPFGDSPDNFQIRTINRLEQGTPEDKLIISADWQISDEFSMKTSASRYGEYLATEPFSSEADDRIIESDWIFDMDFNYSFMNGLTISAGVNNLFDTYPEVHPDAATSTFLNIIGYPLTSPYGFSGRYVYGKIGYQY